MSLGRLVGTDRAAMRPPPLAAAPAPPPQPARCWRGRCWRAIGWGLFGLGLVGMALPLLPTTIFWILAVLAFERSDPRMAAKIRAWPGVGPAIADFLDHGVIARRGKLASLLALGVAAALLFLTLDPHWPFFIAIGVMSAVAAFIASRRERPPPRPAE